MGMFDGLEKHAGHMTEAVNLHGALIYNKLHAIERAIQSSEKPSFGDKFFSIHIRPPKKYKGRLELTAPGSPGAESSECPTNEVWKIQSFVVNGLKVKSPAFIVELESGRLCFAVAKEGMGTETPGGDMVVMPGESIFWEPYEEGEFFFTLTVVRLSLHDLLPPARRDMGPSREVVAGLGTHDPKRDVLLTSTTPYTEKPEDLDVVYGHDTTIVKQ